HQPQQAGEVAVLNRQHRADQRPGSGDGGEVMAEQHPLVCRMIILTVIESMGRGDVGVVERHDLGGKECTVVAISNGQHAEHAEQDRHGVVEGFAVGGFVKQVGKRESVHYPSRARYSSSRRFSSRHSTKSWRTEAWRLSRKDSSRLCTVIKLTTSAKS